uniref:Uncharacterized protein n=1 Tax=Panagrolaimus superbus TaxID=310955 RepID=A0A914XXX7_9BILA
MANALRELDRELNHDNYPHIDYTEIYVLSEGYRHFYENSNVQTFCEPASYIPMLCEKYLKELRKYPFHKKNECIGFSIRSRSTQALVRAYSANLSPCFCRSSICTCTNSLPPFHSMLGSEFSQISLKSPNQARISSPPPFCLDDSPFSSCNPP